MRLYDIGEAFVSGVFSIPVDLYYGSRRTFEDMGLFGEEVQNENAAERGRIADLIKKAFNNKQVIYKLVQIILDDFFAQLPESTKGKLKEALDKAGIWTASRYGAQITLSSYLGQKIAAAVVTKAIVKRLVSVGVGAIVSVIVTQGIIERSSEASKRLRRANPRLHQKLKRESLDVIYFLVEEELAPLIECNTISLRNPGAIEEFVKTIEESIK
ncbi:hypothetical protein [Rhodospira trueperi]|uniref:Uncharacterized protein n=1 Tax=Rhodospira trueperi TaxID=69960 RepID=A0A1G7AAX1_9PROT|nr:hypothetical protein [Rhodospira trueperi]SDE12044.1 hypothetical protein SAMN05421720_103255 [Rhodospira trueperi]